MTNPYYGRGSAIAPFVLANARDVANEFAAVEEGFVGVTAALTENRLASNSTTSLAIGTGAKTLLIGTGRAFAVGQFVSIARTADPTNFMAGQVTSYNAATGALAVNVTETGGSGTYAEWTIALSLPGSTATFLRKTGDTMAGPLNLAGDPATDAEAARKAYVDAVTTAAAMLAKMMTVDGSGSGLDADMLDGLHAAAFARLTGAAFSGDLSVVGSGGAYAAMRTDGDIYANRAGGGAGAYYFTSSGTRYLYFDGSVFNLAGGSLFNDGARVWTLANDGSGSGLDADYLDGLDSTAFVKTSGGTLASAVFRFQTTDNQAIAARPSGETTLTAYGNGTGPALMTFHRPSSFAAFFGLDTDNRWKVGGWSMGAQAFEIWHSGNDGSGSGLDADLLDGNDSSHFLKASANVFNHRSSGANGYLQFNEGNATSPGYVSFHTVEGIRRGFVGWNNGSSRMILASETGWAWAFTDTPVVGGNSMWHAGNDGSGSGLDADLLDGLNSTAFSRVVDASLTENPGFEVYANGKVSAWGYIDVAQDSYANVTFPTRSGGGALFTSWVNVTLGAQTRLGVNEAENTGFSGSPTTSGFTIFNAQNQTIRVWWQAVGL